MGAGGTGDWDLGSLNWSPSGDGVSGPYIDPWDNGALDNAIFGGTAGTVTLRAPITVHNLTANVGGYILTGGTLTLAGVNPTISTIGTNTGFSIDSVIAGTAGFTKAGAGTLTLNGANTFSGDIFLQAGTLNLNGDAALGAAANHVVTSGGAALHSVGALASSRIIELGSGMTTVSGAGVGSARFTGSGGLLVRQGVTLSNDTSDFTGQASFLVNGDAYFTSVGDVGEASALGAGDIIRFTAQNQYSDRLHYAGTGSSSNRGWELATSGGTSGSVFINSGSGTLSLTGDIAMIGGASTFVYFGAQTADMDLLGVISSSSDRPVGFGGGGVNRTITLGGANTYSGPTEIGAGGTVGLTGPVTVRASVLADTGEVSSFGTGTAGGILISNGSVLSYIGGGASSNRAWTIGPALSATGFGGALLNDGTGALALSGAVALAPHANNYNGLLLGGSFAGTNTLSGVISGNGKLGSSGSGIWVLSGANTRTGAILVDGGTLRAGNASAFGTTTGVTVNGGTLDLNGYNLETPTLEGTGGEIALGAATLAVNTARSTSYVGSITGAGGLAKSGNGTLTLSGANSYTGDTSLSGGGITLDFMAPGAPVSNIIALDSTLNMAGGTLTLTGANGVGNSQTFGGLNVTAGSNRIVATSGTGGGMTVDFGAITRTGGLVDFALPTDGDFLTSSASLGGWATVNGSDYAKVESGIITAFTAADYVNKDDAGTWLTGDIVSDAGNAADTPFFGTVATSQQLGGLKYTAAAVSTVNIGPSATLGIDGTIIVASSVGVTDQTISGGSLTGGASGGTLGVLQNGGGRFTIASNIVENGVGTGFTKGGAGIVQLTGDNTYTGVTTLSGGTLQIARLANAGLASSIGAASANASNLVLESGTLHYVGGVDSSTDRGFTLVNGGATAPAIQVDAGRTIEFSGLVTSPDDAGLTKTGWGTLVLSNAANDYVGATTVTGGGSNNNSTLSVNTLADGGIASGIGAASSDSANLVLSDGGRLQYTGGTVEIDRGFTLASGSGRIGVTQAATTLTVAGTAVGTGRFVKDGAGTLILSGTNSYTGGTAVTAGTLVAGSVRAFGGGAGGVGVGSVTVDAGATVDLANNSVFVGGLNGEGSVLLGAATLNINAGGSFAGTISGTGGISVTRFTQTMTGCNNNYTGVTSITSTLTVDCLADGGQASGIGAASSDPANLVINGTLDYIGGSVTIDRGFTTGGGQIVVRDAGVTLEFTGATTGAGFIKDGAGTLVLSGTTTRNGTTQLDAGTLRAGTTNAFGSGRINFAGSATVDLAGHDTTVAYLMGGATVGSNVILGDAMAGDATLTLSGGNGDFGGVISGLGALTKAGSGTQTLSGCGSTYEGVTTVSSGVLAVACLADGDLASSIGASSSAAGNLVLDGGTLRYIGAGGSTDRQFTLGASSSSALDASGSGAIDFTNAGAIAFASPDTVQTIALSGNSTADNSLAAQITDNGTDQTSLTKRGIGTWILTNANSTYTGVTRIEGGVLGVDKLSDGGVASSLGMSSADASNLIIGNSSTLRYTGTGDTTNRLFTLAAGTSFIQSSGTGAIVFTDTGPVTLQGNNQSRTIALGGTNTGNNTLAGSIGNAGTGVTTLAKNDAGTWVLTGNHSYTGSTNINGGILSIGNGGTTGSIVSAIVNNEGTLAFNRSDSITYAGTIVGEGALRQDGAGTTILTGNSGYNGGTTIAAGMLQLGNGGTSGSITGDVTNNGVLAFNRVDTFSFDGVISGSGAVRQDGGGTTALTGINTYTGGTTISAGRLQISQDANLGAASGSLSISNSALETTATLTSSRNVALTGNAILATNAGTTLTLDGIVSGDGTLDKRFAGTLVLTADNSYTGDTVIQSGTLQLGNGGTSGAIIGDVANGGALVFNRSDNIAFDGLISGTGSVTQNGLGVVNLTADNSYSGATNVNAGTLLVNGDQSAATGITSVASGAALGGSGTIGGDVAIADGGILTPGTAGAGTLTIGGNLSLSDGSVLNYEFGQANVVGGALNDLVEVGGDLRLDGTINVSVSSGGTFGGGIYRVFNYEGVLDNQGLALGDMPAGSGVTVQTSVDGQVNLVNSAGLELSFWDGDGGPKFNDTVDGGNGTWHLGGTDNNWTDPDGGVNAAYANGTFAVFAGTGGTVTVDNGGGAVSASGMQFASNGYLVTGDALTLTGAELVIRVGDGTVAGAAMTATIAAELSGAAQLTKTDAGTLILSGANSYAGGTLIEGGTIAISSDGNLGAAAGSLSFNGGTLNTTADIVSDRSVTLAGAGTVLINAGTTLQLSSGVTGAGGLTKTGTGTLLLTGDAIHGGGTTVAAGTLQVGNGGTAGSLTGNVLNNGALVFNRSDDTSFAGAITGSGSLTQMGGGILRLTGDSSYSGNTQITGSELRLENGGTINSAGTTTLTGPNAALTVAGAGSSLTTSRLVLGDLSGGTFALNINDGGQVFSTGTTQLQLGTVASPSAPQSDVTVTVSGAGSLWDVAGGVSVGHFGQSSVRVNVTDGATVRSGSLSMGPVFQSMTNPSDVTVSGDGSTWTTGSLQVYRGTLSLLDGGRLDATTAWITAASSSLLGQGRVLISGTGSELAVSGAMTIGGGQGAIVTLSDDGLLSVGGLLTVGNTASGTGTLNIGAAAGDTAAAAGTVQAAGIAFGPGIGTINFNHTEADYDFASAMSGTGAINQIAGVTVLSGDSAGFTGLTSVSGGSLYVNNALGGDVTVATGGTLGGIGTIGGDVTVDDGAINPGNLGATPGTLTINGSLDLTSNSTLNVNLGQADVVGGPLNDLIEVGGDLVLGGTLNVETAAGGSFDPGIYRVINYTGALTDNGLAIGTIPSPDFYVQTSVANQVNLVNTSGMQFRYWDGTGTKNDGVIDGGDGQWQRSIGNDNWVDEGSIPNAQFADAAFAVFMGTAGTVTVDLSLGDVEASGMQFLTDGYVIEGDAITLTGSQAVIRVGDGTAAGADTTATIGAELTGTAQLVKSDLGTLILTGTNSYAGGTAINGGILQISADDNLGDATGDVSFDGGTLQTTADLATDRAIDLVGTGALLTNAGTTLDLTGAVSGAGSLAKDGAGTLILTGANSYAGGTMVNAGTLFVNGDQSAATGSTSVASGATLGGTGTIGGDVVIADGAMLNPGGASDLPGTLTVGGSLTLGSGSTLAMQFGEANAVGGALNDLIEVGGDLVLDGTLDVSVPASGTFGPGIYRVINYGGALTNNGLDLGMMPSGTNAVQTSVAGQINLVNTDGLALNFWDGNAGPKFNNAVDGGDGLWQNGMGNDNWTDADGVVNAAYADGAFAIFAGTGGTVTIDNSLGDVSASGMQIAADGYSFEGETLTLVGPQSTIRVGDGSTAGAAFTATIAADLTGDTQLVKTDAGTLVLSGSNSYTGGTAIEGGTLAISADANLGDAAGGLTFGGGTLQATADLESDRALSFTGNGTILTDQGTTFTLNGALSGTGSLTKSGAGTLLLTGDNSGYVAATQVAGGTFAVEGLLGSVVTVAEAGRLEGTGRIGGISNAGVVAPGRGGIGTLTVAGDYAGNGGALEIEAVLGTDSSATDRLVVNGATSGNTQVSVINRDGLGGQTVEGIKIIDVVGASDGTFTLNGDYVFNGDQAVIAGAYGYRLYQGGVATPTDGDWYLRSSLLDPGEPNEPNEPNPPLYQPGVPVYEAYGANLQSLNGLPTLQQRVGNRSWAAGANPEGSGIWGRMEGTRSRANAAVSTSFADQDVNSWKMQLGADRVLAESANGERLVAGVTAYYGWANSHIRSMFGNGALKTDGYGLGATLTWYGLQGFYVDGQAQVSWYDSDLDSVILGKLAQGNDGSGEAFSLEVGKRTPVGGKLSVTPQIQMVYSDVRFDRFIDPAGAVVSADKGDSLKSRGGISLDHQSEWGNGSSHIYGVVNLSYEWLDGARTDVSGAPLEYANERLWGELGLGGSVSWKTGVTLYGEVSTHSPFRDFGDSYTLKANAGVRIAF